MSESRSSWLGRWFTGQVPSPGEALASCSRFPSGGARRSSSEPEREQDPIVGLSLRAGRTRGRACGAGPRRSEETASLTETRSWSMVEASGRRRSSDRRLLPRSKVPKNSQFLTLLEGRYVLADIAAGGRNPRPRSTSARQVGELEARPKARPRIARPRRSGTPPAAASAPSPPGSEACADTADTLDGSGWLCSNGT